MSQIMRLRRRAGEDFEINDQNNGHRHEMAFVKNIRRNGILHEADLLADSYGGKLHPRALPVMLKSLPLILRALLRRKVTPGKALLHPHSRQAKELRRIYHEVEGREQRYELNLYVEGRDEEADDAPSPALATQVKASASEEAPPAAASADESPEAGH